MTRALTLAGCLILSATCCTWAAELLANPQVTTDTLHWHSWARKGQPSFAYDTTLGHGDSASLRITAAAKGADGSWVQDVPCQGGALYVASFWFRTAAPDGIASLLIEFNSPAGYAGQVRREVTGHGTDWTHHVETFPAPPQATSLQYEVWCNLDDAGQGSAWFDDFSLGISREPAAQVILDDPIHHILQPGQREIRCRLLQTNPNADPATYRLELRQGDRVLQVREGDLEREVPQALPLAERTRTGALTLRAVVTSAGKTVYDASETIVSAGGQLPVTIGSQEELRVDGEPFFPIGVYWADQADLKYLPEAGFNCVHSWQSPNAAGRAFFAEAQRRGLLVALEMSDTLRGQTDLAAIAQRVKGFRDDPALLCYYPVDEPNPPNTDPAGMQQAYNLIKSLDPGHPVMYVQCNMALLATYTSAADITAVDPYGTPDMVASWLTQARDVTGGRKPVWSVIGTFPWSDETGLPTPEYVRCAAYTSLIGGAKGLLYFTYHYGKHNLRESNLWKPVGELNREVATLAPVLLASQPRRVRASDARVSAATFRSCDQRILLVANRSATETVEATVTLPGVRGEAAAVFGHERVPCEGGLKLRLAPYATAAYRLP